MKNPKVVASLTVLNLRVQRAMEVSYMKSMQKPQ